MITPDNSKYINGTLILYVAEHFEELYILVKINAFFKHLQSAFILEQTKRALNFFQRNLKVYLNITSYVDF